MTRLLLDSLKIPESNNNGSHSIDGMCLHGFSGSERGGGTVPILQAGWGAHAAGAPPASATYDTVHATYMQNS